MEFHKCLHRLVFILLTGKSKKDYLAVIRVIIAELPLHPQVEKFVVDFEAAMWGALPQIFPRRVIKGCVFHWVQAVYRHACNECHLQCAYREQPAITTFLGKLFSLPFLPMGDISQAFEELSSLANTADLRQLMNYIRHTWIE